MVKRKGARRIDGQPLYPLQQTISWLSWLARQMTQHNQSTFFIERMQPDWLPDRQTRRSYSVLVRVLIMLSVIIFQLINTLIFLLSHVQDRILNSLPAQTINNPAYQYSRQPLIIVGSMALFLSGSSSYSLVREVERSNRLSM
jgi:hypothetical protein